MADKDEPKTPQQTAPRRRSRVIGSSWSAPTRGLDVKKGDLPKPKPEGPEEIPAGIAVQPTAKEDPQPESVPPDSAMRVGPEDILADGDLTPLAPPVFDAEPVGALPPVASQDVTVGNPEDESATDEPEHSPLTGPTGEIDAALGSGNNEPLPQAAPPTPPMADEVVCSYCDAENPKDRPVCRQCGTPFAAQTQSELTIDHIVFEFSDAPNDIILIGSKPLKEGVRGVVIEHPLIQPVHGLITKKRVGEYYMKLTGMRGPNGEETIPVHEGDRVTLAPFVSLIVRIKDDEGLPKVPEPPSRDAAIGAKGFATGPTVVASVSEHPPAATAAAQPVVVPPAPVPEPDPFWNRPPTQRQIIDPELFKEISATAREIHHDNSRPPPERRPIHMPQNPPPPPRGPRNEQRHPDADAANNREVEARRAEETTRSMEHTEEPNTERKRRNYQLPALVFAILAVLVVGGFILKGSFDAAKKPVANAAPSFIDASEGPNAGTTTAASVPVASSVPVVAPSATSVVVKNPAPASTVLTSCVPISAALMQEHLGQNDPTRLTKASSKVANAKVHCPKGHRAQKNDDGTLNVSWCSLCPLAPDEM